MSRTSLTITHGWHIRVHAGSRSRSSQDKQNRYPRNEIANVRRQTEALVREIMTKLEDMKTEILVTDERRICGVHDRLNQVEAAVARVDERTRLMRGERA